MDILILPGILLVICCLILAYSVLIESRWYDITETDIKIKQLAPAFDAYRIAHISDIHMDSSMTRERLISIAKMIDEQKPDLIVITGDFVSYKVKYAKEDLRDALSHFSAPDGVLTVLGNHDYLSDSEAVRQILEDVGLPELGNDFTSIERDGAQLHIAGVDDVSAKEARLDLLLPKLPDDAPIILLAHEPDFADVAAATGRFALQLSGHTHGGQVQFPFIGTLYGPEHGHRYQDGLYNVTDDLQLYVTRGVGTVHLPIRFNCRPEITIINLRA